MLADMPAVDLRLRSRGAVLMTLAAPPLLATVMSFENVMPCFDNVLPLPPGAAMLFLMQLLDADAVLLVLV